MTLEQKCKECAHLLATRYGAIADVKPDGEGAICVYGWNGLIWTRWIRITKEYCGTPMEMYARVLEIYAQDMEG